MSNNNEHHPLLLNNTPQKVPVESLRRGLQILELLSSDLSGRGLSLGLIAETMGLQRTTAHNLLKTLQLCGYAANLGEGRYQVGWKVARLEREQILSHFSHGLAMRALGVLSEKTGESLVFAILSAGRRRVVARASSSQDVRVNLDQIEPAAKGLWETVTGWILAACSMPDEQAALLAQEGLPAGYASPEAVVAACRKISRRGHVSEQTGALFSAAVPVLGSRQLLLGALGIYLPRFRLQPAREGELITILQQSAATLAQELEAASRIVEPKAGAEPISAWNNPKSDQE